MGNKILKKLSLSIMLLLMAIFLSNCGTINSSSTTTTNTILTTTTTNMSSATTTTTTSASTSTSSTSLPTSTTSTSTTTGTTTTTLWGSMIYNGYGTVTLETSTGKLTLIPKVSTIESETHAALFVSNATYTQPFQLSFTMKTTEQLRTGSPANTWEVGWAVFGYKPDGKFKYLILKPNGYGLELGESLLNNVQNFLYTSTVGVDQFPINTAYNVVINVSSGVITATINGTQYFQYTMSGLDQLTADGKFGFYTEDASVEITNISMQQL